MAKTKKRNQKSKKNNLPLILAAALVVVLALSVSVLGRAKDARETVAEDGALAIPLSAITETASFYPVTVDGTDMEVLAIRTASGEIRTAFNTCQSCYTSGHGYYIANGTELICQNCGFHFTADEVGVKTGGGCNPWPILAEDRSESAGSLSISYTTLSSAKSIFSNWSKN